MAIVEDVGRVNSRAYLLDPLVRSDPGVVVQQPVAAERMHSTSTSKGWARYNESVSRSAEASDPACLVL